jgi:peptidase S46-like protein
MKRWIVIGLLAGSLGIARADEGMWTFDNFPSETVKEKYGFSPSQEWLDHVRLASVRLAGGCSGSLVSGNGLVMTNHHCARSCIEQISTADHDRMADGFFARREAEEVRCPEIEINQLLEITDVTKRVDEATKGLADQQYNEAQKAEMSRIEKECAVRESLRCDVVPLYHGGRYHLYKYKRYQDVRLVFAPEADIAHFGGDPDNFNFPRYCLDVSFLRLYEGGKPAKTEHHLGWSAAGSKDSDLTFVSGNPGTTSRLFTVSELEYERDVALPRRLLRLAEERGMLTQFQERGAEQRRISTNALLRVENSLKALRGRLEALLDKAFFASKVEAENAFRARLDADPSRKRTYAGAWEAIARAKDAQKRIQRRYAAMETGGTFGSTLLDFARTLTRAAEELPKPNEKRLREFAESKLPALKQKLFSTAPVYDEFEILNLTFGLTKLREDLGADDPFVKKVLGKESPRALAEALVKGSRLKDVAVRRKLFEEGRPALESSDDPMIGLARRVDPDARALRKSFEDEIESVLKRNDELVARAHFEIEGTRAYPDATFTLRLSYGQVKGFPQDGRMIRPITDFAGLFDRETGSDPFALPARWLSSRAALPPSTPMNFCTTNDIIGGNSGSPVIDREGRVTGLIFDGNIQSLGGDYGFDESVNRAVAVHTAALTEALEKVYGAGRILDEILPRRAPIRR